MARDYTGTGTTTGTGRARRLSMSRLAREAGLSKRQKDTALRVARIPKDLFEALVESDNPPSVTQLAELGTRKRRPADDASPTRRKCLAWRDDDEAALRTLRGRVAVTHGVMLSECEAVRAAIRLALANPEAID